MNLRISNFYNERIIGKLSGYLFVLLLSMPVVILFSPANFAIPSFARQTNLSCNYCHYTYPALTPFGRQFKLNGYTLISRETITATSSDSERTTLALLSNMPVSAMFIGNVTSVSKQFETEGDNTFVQAPSEMSIFLAGEITPRLGAYIETTYELSEGTIGLDMLDIRYANHTRLASKDLLYGVTLNNMPTVQDVWNTLGAWSFPYVSSEAAPSPSATIMGIMEGVTGLGAYALYNKLIYAEFSVYHASPAGVEYPPNSGWEPNVKGLAPYWRVALQHQWISQYLEIGTYGMSSKVYQSGISGPTNEGNNLGFDAQYENVIGNGSSLIYHAAYELAKITQDENKNNLNSFRTDLTYNFPEYVSLSAGFFSITGDNFISLIPMEDMASSTTGKPDSNGEIFQFTFIPWMNTQFAIQYTVFNKFDGSSENYDGNGRNASDNNTLNVSAWLAL